MNKWKEQVRRWLFPNAFLVFLLFNVAAGLLIYVFVLGKSTEPIAYLAYMVSFYALVVVCVRIPAMVKRINNGLHSNKYAHRFLTDKELRTWFFAYFSLSVNGIFALFKVIVGHYYESAWLYAMAGYHMLASIMVFVIVYREKNNKEIEEESRFIHGLKSYELCGWFMILMNTAISVIVFYVVFKQQTITYPGFMIYAIAAFSFYSMIMAIVNLVKYRRKDYPAFSAIKRISLAKALVSMFTLQVAMLTQFSTGTGTMVRMMNFATGTAVCASIMSLAVFMLLGVRKDYREVRRYEQ